MRRVRLSTEVTNGLPIIISFIQEILVGSSVSSKPKALVCLRSWVQYGIPFEYVTLNGIREGSERRTLTENERAE